MIFKFIDIKKGKRIVMINISSFNKSYGDFNLYIPSLHLEDGNIYALIGKNGSGKTTFIKGITEQISHGGTVDFDGIFLEDNREKVLSLIGYVGDQLRFTQNMKVKDFIKFSQSFYSNWNKKLCNDLLKSLNLNQYLQKRINELSKGNLMKLSILICLSHQPKYIILDEPTSGLDIAIREEVLNSLLIFKRKDTVILFSSHIIEDIEHIASHIILINEGKIIVNDKKDNILASNNGQTLKEIALKYISE